MGVGQLILIILILEYMSIIYSMYVLLTFEAQ